MPDYDLQYKWILAGDEDELSVFDDCFNWEAAEHNVKGSVFTALSVRVRMFLKNVLSDTASLYRLALLSITFMASRLNKILGCI